MTLPNIDTKFMLEFLVRLLNTPSPTGYCEAAIALVEDTLRSCPELTLKRTRKGALLATWPGEKSDAQRALTAHVDTLGAMVKEIKANGRLKLTRIGGFAWNTVEGEGCTVFTNQDGRVRGSLLLEQASTHVFGTQVNDLKREDNTMEIRLDARTSSIDDTYNLGISVGDFVAFDPRVEITNGFVRSRHLDDKASVAALVTAIKTLHDSGMTPAQTTHFLFSNFEEVGHGAAAGIPPETTELVAVDMATVGEGQTSDEFHASICVKDGGGPYHHGLSQRLRALADVDNIPYRVDIYTYYGSDGSAYLRAGGDVAVALIGPGIDASHNYERTHTEALVATTQWVLAYMR
ncbi:MAG TPA: M42 family metallopeptidase [Anaerolineaceae bacterium]